MVGVDLVRWEGWILSDGRGGCCPMGGVDVVQWEEVDIVQW